MLDIVSGITAAVTTTQQIHEIAENFAAAELRPAIALLTEQLGEITLQALELTERNRHLEAQVAKLKAPPDVVYRDNVYFTADGDGPFCPRCYDSEQRLIRIPEVGQVLRTIMKYRCDLCKAHVKGAEEV